MTDIKTKIVSLKDICSDDFIDQDTIESRFQGHRDKETDLKFRSLGIDMFTLSNYVGQLLSGMEIDSPVELVHDGAMYRVIYGTDVVSAHAYAGREGLTAVVHDLDSLDNPTYKRKAN